MAGWLSTGKLKHRLAKTREIRLLPYYNGVVLKAGELPPPLGDVKTEGLSPLLVKINQLISPVRFYVSRSLHFYLEYEGLQFDKESIMEWNKRLDEASALLDKDDIGKYYEPR